MASAEQRLCHSSRKEDRSEDELVKFGWAERVCHDFLRVGRARILKQFPKEDIDKVRIDVLRVGKDLGACVLHRS